MKMIKINAKSAPKFEQIMPRVNAGFKNIEIQLLNNFVSEGEYEITKKVIEENNVNITVVHTPLIEIEGEVLLEEVALIHLLQDKYYEIFCDTCKYAQFIADIEKSRVKIVIHNTWSKEDWEMTNIIEEKIAPKIKRVLSEYKDIDLVVENSTTVGEKNFKSIIDMEDVSYSVKELNKVIGNRAETIIDTCHTMMNWEAWKRISSTDITNWDEAFLKSTKYEKLGLMHLNNVRDLGIKKRDHGIPFDKNIESDMERLKQIMEAYDKYAECEITIEVREENYEEVPQNLITTKDALESLGYKLNLG